VVASRHLGGRTIETRDERRCTVDAERLPDGRLRVPMRAESPDGTIGDGMVIIDRDHPAYQEWSDYLDDLSRSAINRSSREK
jgi:hypothetical protein